jgi:hypothetical protein
MKVNKSFCDNLIPLEFLKKKADLVEALKQSDFFLTISACQVASYGIFDYRANAVFSAKLVPDFSQHPNYLFKRPRSQLLLSNLGGWLIISL